MHSALRRVIVVACVLLTGCAAAHTTSETVATPASNTRPNAIVIHPFIVDPATVGLDSAIGARLYRKVESQNDSAEQLKLAQELSASMCQQVAVDLQQKNYSATCATPGAPLSGDDVLVIDGQFTALNEGNRLRRLAIGFGVGASTLDTSVVVSQALAAGAHPVMTFTTHADSGKMPGAVVTGPAAGAASGAAVAIGANAAVGGLKTHQSSVDYLSAKTASQIVTAVQNYYQQQGWTG